MNYGNLLVRQQRYEEAVVYYHRALHAAPSNAVIHFNLGTALLKSGRPQAAVSAYRQALREDPRLAGAKLQLAWVLATAEDDTVRDGAEAVRRAEDVRSEFGDGHARLLDVLAAAYAEAGRFDDACRMASIGIGLAASNGLAEHLEPFRARLVLYRLGKPYREASGTEAEETVSEIMDDGS
jgi:tetratricopeptide (TPR) repeat protein